jgi:hypothetical protein
MASMDEPTLEYWIRDSVYNVSNDKVEQIIKLLEPLREGIEYKLSEDYDPEEHSWRDYRNSLWYCVPDELNKEVDKIINE